MPNFKMFRAGLQMRSTTFKGQWINSDQYIVIKCQFRFEANSKMATITRKWSYSLTLHHRVQMLVPTLCCVGSRIPLSNFIITITIKDGDRYTIMAITRALLAIDSTCDMSLFTY